MKAQQAQSKTQPEGQAGNKMNIDVKINSISMEGNILATASINLNQCLAIRNVRLMNGEKGMFRPCHPIVPETGSLGISVFQSQQSSGHR